MKLYALGQVFEYEIEKENEIEKVETSIVIPAYNSEKFLSRAVISALTQDTSVGYEVIIVDDGGRERARDTLDSLVLKDPRISLFRKENEGLIKAFNLGVLLSRGVYIIRLDADDELLPEAVEVITDYFRKNPKASYVYTDGYWVGPLQGWEWEKHSPVPLDKRKYVNPWIKREFNLETLFNEMYLGHARAYRKEAFIKVGGFDPRWKYSAEDWDLALKISEIGEIHHIRKKLHKYYLQETGITKTVDQKKRYESRRKIIIEALQRRKLNFSEIPESVRKQFNLTEEDLNKKFKK